jgi:preprotein translocase subunit SecG
MEKSYRRSVMRKDELKNLMDMLSGIFIRCFFLCCLLLIVWLVFYSLGGKGDLGYSIHSKWFEMSKHDYVLLNYYGIAFTKICAILFFLFPYIAIRLMLRKK